MKQHNLEIGSGDIVEIEKLFGPTIFASLRITAETGEGWVIERQWISTGEWLYWCTIPAQITQEFDCAECHERPSSKDWSGKNNTYCSEKCMLEANDTKEL